MCEQCDNNEYKVKKIIEKIKNNDPMVFNDILEILDLLDEYTISEEEAKKKAAEAEKDAELFLDSLTKLRDKLEGKYSELKVRSEEMSKIANDIASIANEIDRACKDKD